MKLIAGNIKNLTDARYFSAVGAHALIYPDVQGWAKIKEITDWVAGPATWIEWGLEFKNESREIDILVNRHVKLDSFASVDFPYITRCTYWPTHGASEVILDLAVGSIEKMKGLSSKEIYVSIEKNPLAWLKRVSDLYPEIGFYAEGSDENQVGLKSYDKMEAFIDLFG